MAKIRIIISLFGILLILVLYRLPGGVVDNGNNNLEAKDQGHNNIMDSTGVSLIEVHNQELAEETVHEIQILKQRISLADSEQAINLTDSLSSIYIASNLYDSAAMLYEQLLSNNSDINLINKTADLYFDAYNFAMDREKASYLGGKARQYYNKVLGADSTRFDRLQNFLLLRQGVVNGNFDIL